VSRANKKLIDIAKDVAAKAQKKGASGARVSVSRNRESTVEWRDGKLDRLRESTKMGLSVELFVDGRYSGNHTSDMRGQGIDRFLEETIGSTRYLAKDPHRKLADPKRYEGRHAGDLELYDAAAAGGVDGAQRKEAVRRLEKAARSGGSSKEIVSVSSSFTDEVSESALVCTNGMEGSKRSSVFVVTCATSVADEGARKPRGWWYAVTRKKDDLPGLESVGKEATRRALLLKGASPVKTGRYPCIIENSVARRLLSHLLRPLRGRYLQQKRSFFIEKMGTAVGSEALDIVDSPHLKGALGSRTYDGEGMSTITRPVFEKGVLKSYYLDTYYASKLSMEPTTRGPTNLVVKTGGRDLDALMQAMGEGILVTGFSGGNSNSATGDFSIGIRGLWVENGRPTKAVSEMNLAGNHLTFWKRLAETGDDPFVYSSVRVPSLRFEPVQFSGT
jgi:PmbA protein